MQVVCVLKSGREYTPQKVEMLYRCCRRHIRGILDFYCITDLPDSDFPLYINVIPFQYNWPGWWSKFELFHPDLPIYGPRVFLDLDTVVVGDLSQWVDFDVDLVSFSAWYHTHTKEDKLNSSIMWWRSDVSSIFADAKLYIESRHFDTAAWNKRPWEQEILQNLLVQHGFTFGNFNELDPASLYSYKYDKIHGMKNPPNSAKVIVFHGKPRPWDIKHQWITDAWAPFPKEPV